MTAPDRPAAESATPATLKTATLVPEPPEPATSAAATPAAATPEPATPEPATSEPEILEPATGATDRTSVLERRIEELEIRNAHQEYALQGLGEELVHLQQANTQLTRQLQALVERIAAFDPGGPGGDSGTEPPPPHY